MRGLKSSYMKSRASFGKEEQKMCNHCGLPEHKSRERECKAFSQTCNKCGRIGHFKRVCKSKNKAGDKRDQDSTGDKDKEDTTAAILGEKLFNTRGEYWLKRMGIWHLVDASEEQLYQIHPELRKVTRTASTLEEPTEGD